MSHHHPQWNAAGTWAAAETQQQWHYGAYQPHTEQTAYRPHAEQTAYPPNMGQTTVVHRAPMPSGGMRTKLTVGLAAAAIGLLAAGAWVSFGPAAEASADTVRLQPVSSAGDSPFLTPVGQDKTGVTPPAGTGGSFAGDTPGLYAEGDEPSCEPSKLVAGLQADSVKTAAWAEAMGIEPTEIPKFVNSLSPVLLRSDTAVTDHGFKAGTFAPSQAVLQAGTSVLINGFGEPTVKCYSGDPLTKPVDYDVEQVQFVGEPWTGFEPEHCTFVEPTHVVIEKHVFIDYEENRPHEKPGKPYPWEPNPEHEEKGEHGEKGEKGEHGEENGKKETPDPAKEKAAMEAKAAAEMAAKDARAARDKADDAAANILAAQGKVTDADARLQTAQSAVAAAQAKVDAGVPGAVGELAAAQAAADEALRTSMQVHTELDNAKNQEKYADAAADDAEAVSMQAKKTAEQKQADADRTAGRIPGNTGIVPPDLKTLDGEQVDGTENAATAEGATDGTTTEGTDATGTTTDGTDETTTDGTTENPATDSTDGTDETRGTKGTTEGATGTDGTPGTTEGTTPDTDGTTPSAGGDSSGTASPFMTGMAPDGPPADTTPPATGGGTSAGPPAQQGPAQQGPAQQGPAQQGPAQQGPPQGGSQGPQGGGGPQGGSGPQGGGQGGSQGGGE